MAATLNDEQLKMLNKLAGKIAWNSIELDTPGGETSVLAIFKHSKAEPGKDKVTCLLDVYGGGKVVKANETT